MRKYLLLCCLLFVVGLATGQDIVQIKVSKPYCVFNFLETATGQQGTSSTLRNFITTKTKDDTVFRKLCSDFTGIQLDYSYRREEFPENRRQYRSTKDLINIALVNAETFEEFKTKAVGILPNSELQKLAGILEQAESHYDSVVWNTTGSRIIGQQQALETYSAQTSDLFTMLRQFYNSGWTNGIPFIVSLYPIPGNRGNSTATPHANSLCVGVFADETRHIERMGVVVHEMCHVLYDEQPNTFQHEIEKWFAGNKSPYAQYAYNFFDEALATALGNGWAYRQISGHMDTTEWYNNEYINGYAKVLYPLVEGYMNSYTQLDSEFVSQAIVLFAERFPNAISDYGVLLNRVSIYSDAETKAERGEVFNAIGSEFQLTNTNFSTPISHETSLDLLKNSEHTQLVIVDRNHKENMNILKKIFPQLSSFKPAASSILSFYDQSNRPVIILYATNKADVPALVKKMKQRRNFDLKKMVQE
jgi:hypothetical protein